MWAKTFLKQQQQKKSAAYRENVSLQSEAVSADYSADDWDKMETAPFLFLDQFLHQIFTKIMK